MRSLVAFALPSFLVVLPTSGALQADDSIEFFEKKIRPVLVEHCYECHSTTHEKQGGLLLDSRAGIQAGGDHGAIIDQENPSASLLMEAIRYEDRELQMPPSGKLPEQMIADFQVWVKLGAPDSRERALADESIEGMSIEDGKEFWSFRPVIKPAVPEFDDEDFVRNPIDAFILKKLRDRGLQPAKPASKQVLLRRVTQDLIGLPPTPSAVQDFLNDDAPDAFTNVVEQLLDSPRIWSTLGQALVGCCTLRRLQRA